MLIGLTGRKRSGKSTVARYLVENHGFTELSFAQPLKDMALAVDPIVSCSMPEASAVRLSCVVETFGWENAKDVFPEVRRFLQRLGTEGVRNHLGADTWVDLVDAQICRDRWFDPRLPIVIADVRFENEADLVRKHGGTVVEVVRDSHAHDAPEHASEAGVDADVTLTNPEGSPEELFAAVEKLLG